MKINLTDFGKGMTGIAFVCPNADIHDYIRQVADRAGECEIVYRGRNGKPADAPTSAGKDSLVVSPSLAESVSDTTIAISPRAIAEIKKLVTDCERGNAIRRLIDGEVITSQDYPHITTLAGKLAGLLGNGIIGKTKVSRRRKNGKSKLYVGYFFRIIPTIQ